MVKELRKAILVAMTLAAILAACAPAQQTTADVESQVATQVAATVGAHGSIADAVAATVAAQAAQATATLPPTPTTVTLNLPTVDPAIPTVTPFVVVPPSSGSSGTQPLYGCSFAELKPKTNQFKPGDPFDILWWIKNTGSKDWPSKKDLDFYSGTHLTKSTGVELPALKSGETTTVSFDANAPKDPGFYEMKFKVEGGLCFPFTDIEVGKPRDP